MVILGIALTAIVAAAGFAADQFATLRARRSEQDEAKRQLSAALTLISEHPESFGPAIGLRRSDHSLKSLAQDSSTRRGVTIGYLSESERETEGGRREQRTVVRLTRPLHSNLVAFLEDLESGGTLVREVHVKPSRDQSDAYDEAEVVFSVWRTTKPERKP